MLNASTAYKNSISQPMRNRGYIKVTIGLMSMDAQANAEVVENNLSYPVLSYSNPKTPFSGASVDGEYATSEPEFCKVDGTRYFAPEAGTTYVRNNGALSRDVLGGLYIQLSSAQEGYNISGLSIDFGPVFPTSFLITTDNEEYTVPNTGRYFESDLSFVGATHMIITPLSMANGANARLRIYSMKFGKALTFENDNVVSFSSKEYVSPICDSLPSYDMTLVVSNTDGRFDVDDDYNVMSFMSIGQEVTVQHGYDVNDDGNIEWLDPYVSYLSTWDANDKEATFTSYDKFAMEKQKFVLSGDSLFDGTHTMRDVAEEIVYQAYGDQFDFSSDNLDNYIAQNPLPNSTYPELFQMIANATQSMLRIKSNGVLGLIDPNIDSGYLISVDQMTDNLIARKTNKIQSVNVSYLLWTKNSSASASTVTTEDIYVDDSEGYSGEFFFDECYSNWTVSCDDANVTASIVDSNPRYVSVVAIRTNESPGTAKLTISAKKYTKSTASASTDINDVGENINWDNPLISNQAMAKDVAGWIGDYYRPAMEYEMSWRGDPRVEAGDIVTVDRKNKKSVSVRIYQNEFFFNGAWSGHILGRRVSNG